MKIIKQLIKELIILVLILGSILGFFVLLYTILKNIGYSNEQILVAAMYGAVLSIIFSGVITLIYNVFIAFPAGIVIEKQKKYKEVRTFWIIPKNSNYLNE